MSAGMPVTTWEPRLLADRSDTAASRGPRGRAGASRAAMLDQVEASGLLGRGGAGFPLSRKLRTVAASGGATVVVANGCEGEPASAKDTLLLTTAPHLVLDGVQTAAWLVGADQAHLVVHQGSSALGPLRRAQAQRDDAVLVRLTEVPARYVASEESALVNLLNGGPALPMFTPPRPFERGVDKRPTLVNNVETLAHLSLVAAHGADWFRQVGDPDEPGTQLMTVSGPGTAGPVDRAVLEIETGASTAQVLAAAGVDLSGCAAVLVGGYFGTWHAAESAANLALTHRSLRASGGALGAGIVVGLPTSSCGIAETGRVAAYLAAHSAQQCGPCLNGLPAIAGALRSLALGPWDERLAPALDRWLTVVPGRGACRHPDGAVRLVISALQVFAADVEAHRVGKPCAGVKQGPVLPIPNRRAAS
jgi:NADH:ubiquinone oxidoreductase subunit F (NADH-binding)